MLILTRRVGISIPFSLRITFFQDNSLQKKMVPAPCSNKPENLHPRIDQSEQDVYKRQALRRTDRTHVVANHQQARLMQAYGLKVLQRRAAGQDVYKRQVLAQRTALVVGQQWRQAGAETVADQAQRLALEQAQGDVYKRQTVG